MKKINLIKNNSLCIYTLLNILFVFISSYLFTTDIIKYDFYGNMIHKVAILNIIVSVILLIKNIKEKNYKINIIDILLLLVIVFAGISTLLAYDTKIAINGERGRYEGLYAITYYISLVFISSFLNKKQKNFVIVFILLGGFIQIIYGLFQMFEIDIVKIFHHRGELWVTGFTLNPNFFGQLMLICLLYSIGFYFIERKELIVNIMYILLITLFMVGLLISNTLSCMLALIFIMILLLIHSIKNKYYKKMIVILLIFFMTMIAITKIDKTRLLHDLVKTKNEATEISKGNLDDSYGTKRMAIWKQTVKIVPKYLINGIGVDNFAKVLDGKPIVYGHYLYDKAHSEPLQILVTEGIFALITYILLYIIVIYRGFKEHIKDKEIYFILPVLGYVLQALFSISVIEVAPIFYITLGLLINREKLNKFSIKNKKIKISIILIVFIYILSLLFINSKNTEVLSSWKDNSISKNELIDYVHDITRKDSINYIKEEDRIAVFDFDGTLYSETDPTYISWNMFLFRVLEDSTYEPTEKQVLIAQTIKDELDNNKTPTLGNKQVNTKNQVFKDMTLEEYKNYINDFLELPSNNYEGIKRKEEFYKPMLEVIDYLEKNKFKIYICSGTDRIIVTEVVKDVIDIPESHIIGTDKDSIKNVNMQKVYSIKKEIGKQPVLAFGNSNSDIEMLKYVVNDNKYNSKAFMIINDDTVREKGNVLNANKMIENYRDYRWTFISMKNDWDTIYDDKK